jgi:hypothetical protein
MATARQHFDAATAQAPPWQVAPLPPGWDNHRMPRAVVLTLPDDAALRALGYEDRSAYLADRQRYDSDGMFLSRWSRWCEMDYTARVFDIDGRKLDLEALYDSESRAAFVTVSPQPGVLVRGNLAPASD